VSVVLGTRVRLSQRSNAHSAVNVNLSRRRGTSDVKPIRVVRGVLFEGGGFDDINPLRDFHLFEKKRSKSVSIARNK